MGLFKLPPWLQLLIEVARSRFSLSSHRDFFFTHMEVNKGSQREYLQKFDRFPEAALVDSVVRITGNDAFALPGWKFGSKSSSTIQPEHSEDEGGRIIEQKVQNFEENSVFLHGEIMCKTKPLSPHFVINIDEHVKHGSGVTLPLEVLSGRATGQSPLAHTEDPDSTNWKKIQIEPFSAISLRFHDVKYKAAVKGTKKLGAEKHILHGITGSVHAGEVLALMGPSGSGKTTLLHILSGRLKFSSGSITYNGRLYTKSLNRRIGFVTQDDVVFPHLTVKETLVYAALLRLPNILTRQQKRERAMSVISELGLERCQDTVIGGKFVRGISGGERKRVCIGNEILLNPSLLFLDEPTSGLDSTTALTMVQKLQNIAEAGMTVVTTIHQPSSRLFSIFDKLILLAKGNVLYFGKASDAMLYFSSIGCCPLIAMNPAEFLIDLANGNINDKSIPSELEDKFLPGSIGLDDRNGGASPDAIHEYLLDAYRAEVMKTRKRKILKHVVIEGKALMQEKMNSREWTSTWWEQFSILFRRGLKERRHEYFSLVRITQVIATSIIVGLLWWHPDHDASSPSPRQLQDQAGLLFFISVFWGFLPVFTAIFTFPQERAMLVKERSVGMYRLSAYFASRNISDLPLDLILPTVFLLIVYFMAGLKLSFSAFSLTLLAIYLCIIAAQGLGLTIGAAFMDVKKATTLASIIIMTFMLSGGFFLQKVPPFVSWIRYISFNYHTYRLFLKIQHAFSGPALGPGSCNQYRSIREPGRFDWGATEVGAMVLMIIVYRLLAYSLLRKLDARKMA